MQAPTRELDPRTARRMAYRLAGRAFAIAGMHVPIKRISIEGLWSGQQKDRNGEIDFEGFNGRPEQMAFAYIVGECAANLSGVPHEIEPQTYGPPDLSSMEDKLESIVKFAERSMGPISGIAEALLANKFLSEVEFNRLLISGLKQRTV